MSPELSVVGKDAVYAGNICRTDLRELETLRLELEILDNSEIGVAGNCIELESLVLISGSKIGSAFAENDFKELGSLDKNEMSAAFCPGNCKELESLDTTDGGLLYQSPIGCAFGCTFCSGKTALDKDDV